MIDDITHTLHKDTVDKLRINDLINFQYVYDNSEKQSGIVLKIESDSSFYKILHVLVNDKIEVLPASIITFDFVK